MIQRIQSLWLFLAAVALIAVLFLPVGVFKLPNGLYACTAFNMTQTGAVPPINLPVWLIGLISVVAGFISFLAIFLFKKRGLQIRFTRIALVLKVLLLLGLVGLFYYFRNVLDAWVGYGPAVLMPLLGIVLDLLAINGIHKDDQLVKSLDRIR